MFGRQLRSWLVALVVLALPTAAQAAIVHDGNESVAATSALFTGDGSHDQTWADAPESGDLVVACELMLTVATTFVEPDDLSDNVDFNNDAATITIDTAGTDITAACWYGVATGVPGTLRYNTAAATTATAKVWQFSFTADNGFPSNPADSTQCEETETSAAAAHDDECSLVSNGSAGVVSVGLSIATTAGTTFTIDSDWTALTGVANQVIMAYNIDASSGTVDFNNTVDPARTGVTVAQTFEENAGGGGGSTACRHTTLLGVGGACSE